MHDLHSRLQLEPVWTGLQERIDGRVEFGVRTPRRVMPSVAFGYRGRMFGDGSAAGTGLDDDRGSAVGEDEMGWTERKTTWLHKRYHLAAVIRCDSSSELPTYEVAYHRLKAFAS